MKKEMTGLFSQTNIDELENRVSKVNEAIAIDFSYANNKISSVADLWNIKRHGKSRGQRTFYF